MMEPIRIVYQRHDDPAPVAVELAPEDYFDPVEPDEAGEPIYVATHLDPARYTPFSPADLKLLTIVEPSGLTGREFRYQYLAGESSYTVHSLWPDGTEELIHSTDVTPDTYHLIRTQKSRSGYWSVVLNLCARHDDEKDAERSCTGSYSWEQLCTYWDDIAARVDAEGG